MLKAVVQAHKLNPRVYVNWLAMRGPTMSSNRHTSRLQMGVHNFATLAYTICLYIKVDDIRGLE